MCKNPVLGLFSVESIVNCKLPTDHYLQRRLHAPRHATIIDNIFPEAVTQGHHP